MSPFIRRSSPYVLSCTIGLISRANDQNCGGVVEPVNARFPIEVAHELPWNDRLAERSSHTKEGGGEVTKYSAGLQHFLFRPRLMNQGKLNIISTILVLSKNPEEPWN